MSTPFSSIEEKMRIEERYQELLLLQKEIDTKLQKTDFVHMKELMLWMAASTSYQALKTKENGMIMLECFCKIWLEERKQQEQFGIDENIFYGIKSLQDIERKYQAIKYCALRLENNMPIEFCEQAVDELIDYKVGGIALTKIFISESQKREDNIVRMAQLLKEKQQLLTSITLLQYSLKTYEGNSDMLLELAECWLEGQQWKQAYECLKQITERDASIDELIEELEKVI